MIAYLKQFVNTSIYPLFSSPLKKGRMIGMWLLLANILLVFFLILLNNLGVLPITNFGNFVFFVFLLLLLALYRPGWSFLFFVGTIAIENINVAPVELGINVRPYQLLAAFTIISVVVRYLAKRLNFELPKWKLWDLAPIIFVIAGFLNYGGSTSIVAASFVAIYFLVRVFVQDINDIKRIAPFFISSAIIVVIYGIWQNIAFMRGAQSFEVMPGRANSTFTEPDWLGIYLVLLIAVIYAIIFYFSKLGSNPTLSISNFQFPRLPKPGTGGQAISKQIQNTKYQIPNTRILLVTGYWLLVTLIFISLILTVSRSAWLGALIVTIFYLLIIFTNLKLKLHEWQWKNTLKIKIGILISLVVSIAIVYFFNLTSFQLFNRFQSTGTGQQKITISCNLEVELPNEIKSVGELNKYSCRHINLEEIVAEKANGKYVTEIYRADPNVSIRKVVYQKSWQQIKKHPILGIGWGSIGDVLGKDERGVTLNTSNIFLELWLGSGLIGFLSFCAIWFYILVNAVKYTLGGLEEDKRLQKTVALFIILGWASFTITNLFNAGIFMGILWLFIGISSLNYAHRD